MCIRDRVTALQADIGAKITNISSNLATTKSANLTSYIDTSVKTLSANITKQFVTLKANLNAQMTNASLSSQQFVTDLEFGKVQLLLNYNNLWRKNFRVINST